MIWCDDLEMKGSNLLGHASADIITVHISNEKVLKQEVFGWKN